MRQPIGAADDETDRRTVLGPPLPQLGRQRRAVERAAALVEHDHDCPLRNDIGDGDGFFDASPLGVATPVAMVNGRIPAPFDSTELKTARWRIVRSESNRCDQLTAPK